MSIEKLPAVICVLSTLVPYFALAQADSELSAQRSGDGIDTVPADYTTVSFVVPPDEIHYHDYHIKTFTDNGEDAILTSATRPDARGVVDTSFLPAHLSASPDISSSDYFHSFLAAFNKRTNEWHYQMNLTQVPLKRFVIALAVSRNQPTGRREINPRQPDAPRPRLYEFEQQLPEDIRVSLNGERLFFADIASLINTQTGCVLSEEGGTLKVAQC